MIKIQFNFSETCYDYGNHTVRISPDDHNNFQLNTQTGQITLKSIPTANNTLNTPGNGIDGRVGDLISVVRLNNSVSRKIAGDPTPSNEGVVIPDLLDAYFARLGV